MEEQERRLEKAIREGFESEIVDITLDEILERCRKAAGVNIVAICRLRKRALEDLIGAHEFSYMRFGKMQAETYILDLHRRFQLLACFPGTGTITKLGKYPASSSPQDRM